MKRIFPSLILLLLAAGTLPLAAAPPKGVPAKSETIIEATAETVLLPSTASGILVVKACEGCPLQSFRATGATVYALAGKSVGLKQLQATLAKNSRMNVDITLSAKTREIEMVEATPQSGNK